MPKHPPSESFFLAALLFLGAAAMARKWEINEGVYAWNMEQCEELLLIAGYEEIKPNIAPGLKWPDEFENHFYQHGNGIACYLLDEINAVRRRLVLPRLEYLETDVLEYGRSTNKLMKSETRRRVRADLASVSLEIRQKMVARALEETKALVPPHIPYEEYKSRRQQFSADSLLSRAEIARRLRASEQAAAPIAPPPAKPANLPLEKAVVMLKYAKDPELRSGIIAKMSSDDALLAVEKIEDTDLRDALIRHSLAAA
jgi:hypothetical protein